MKKGCTFAFTVGAIREVCERCPNHDIDKILDLFTEEDTIKRLDNMVWFICTLNKWGVFKETGSFDGALTENEILAMEMGDINEMFESAMASFKGDSTPEDETEPAKKAEAAPKSKS